MTLGRRSPQAVQELERLQQQERAAAGESPITTAAVLRLLRDDIHGALISGRLAEGGLDAMVANAADDEKVVDERVTACDTWHLDDPTQWSRFESPGIRWGIAGICARIEKVFASHKWELPEFPVVGTLTTGQVSAVTQKSDTGAPLILIDNGFFKFAGIMAQLRSHLRWRFERASGGQAADRGHAEEEGVRRRQVRIHHRHRIFR
jgi:hypothetical protein